MSDTQVKMYTISYTYVKVYNAHYTQVKVYNDQAKNAWRTSEGKFKQLSTPNNYLVQIKNAWRTHK